MPFLRITIFSRGQRSFSTLTLALSNGTLLGEATPGEISASGHLPFLFISFAQAARPASYSGRSR